MVLKVSHYWEQKTVATKKQATKALKEIKKLVADNVLKVQVEKYKAKKAQLLSLTGTPNEVLRKISGLTKT